MRTLTSLLILILVILVFSLNPETAYSSANIWAVDDTEKIRPADHGQNMQTDHEGTILSQSPYNLVWQNGQVHLFGAKNEIIAFQLIVEANGSPSTINNVGLPRLCHNSGYCIENTNNPNDYYDFRGRNIEILSEHYIPIQGVQVDSDKTRYPDPYYLDEVPEILVPITAPSGKGGLPLTIPTNSNQALWFDIYLPKNAPAGDYTGSLSITTDGSNQTIPVKLKVYNFQLPDETHVPNIFRINPSGVANRLGISDGINKPEYRAELTKYFQTAHRHRLNLTNNGTIALLDAFYKDFYNGNYYNPANKYYGPGENTGHNVYAIGISDLCRDPVCLENSNGTDGAGSGFAPPTEAQWRTASNEWVNWFSDPANGLTNILYFRYLIDEPNRPTSNSAWAYSQLQKYANWLHNNPGPGGNLKTFCTAPIDDLGIGYCDIWALNKTAYKVGPVEQARARGELAGLYNGGNPMYGAGMQLIHTAAVDARVIPWVMERYNIDFYFLFSVLSQYVGSCDFFNNNCTNGNLFYPSDDPKYPAEARGFNGPLVSVRFKYWRRGAQDYEYFWLAKQQNLGVKAAAIVSDIVPVALDETPFTKLDHDNPWPARGYQFELKRRQLAELIAGTSSTPVTQDISLSAGWNLVSSFIAPSDPRLETVLAGIESNMLLLKNNQGQTYWPALNVNAIGDWDVQNGYLIYMNNADTLTLNGAQVVPANTAISLSAGWNSAAYLLDTTLPINQALAGISSGLYLARNEAGQLYWPEFNINQIGKMQPGEGYQIYMNDPASLVYPGS